MTTTLVTPAVLVIANRAASYGTVARWLLHDLRSPTQALSLVAELLAGPEADPDPELQMTLRESTRQLAGYLDVLDRTLRTLPASATSGPVVLSDVLTFLSQLYQSCRSSIQLDLSQPLAQPLPAVSAVEEQLEHALLNLLMNAFEAVGDREDGRVTITAAVQDGAVDLMIDDNGPGVAPELRDRLFEPYVTTKRRSGHVTGLGLTVARHILERFGGTLTYRENDGPGTRFVARLLAWPPTPQ